MGTNIGKNISGKYSQKPFDHAKQSGTDAFKVALRRAIKITPEAAGDLIDNKIADKITEVSKNLQQNNSETIKNEHDKEISKERYISQGIIDDLRLK